MLGHIINLQKGERIRGSNCKSTLYDLSLLDLRLVNQVSLARLGRRDFALFGLGVGFVGLGVCESKR